MNTSAPLRPPRLSSFPLTGDGAPPIPPVPGARSKTPAGGLDTRPATAKDTAAPRERGTSNTPAERARARVAGRSTVNTRRSVTSKGDDPFAPSGISRGEPPPECTGLRGLPGPPIFSPLPREG